MSTRFYTGRAFPSELQHLGGMGDGMNTESAVADIFRSLTTGAVDFFGGSSSFAKEAQANAAAMQAQAYGQQEAEKAQTTRTLIWVGGGVIAAALLVAVLARPRSNMAGYRRRRRARR